MRNHLKIIISIFTLFFALSCNLFSTLGTQATTMTPAETATSPAQPSPVPATATPTAALPSVTPTSTAVPIPTATPAPTSLNASGPYIIFKGQAGIWMSNPDGSFPYLVSKFPGQGDLRRAISPQGDFIAVVVTTDEGLDLDLVSIPSGDTENIARLIDITTSEEISDPTGAKALAAYAIRDYDSVAWQPGEGRFLAFIGAIDGPTADLYVYDTQTKEITQLTSGASQSIMPIWSPDGQYLLNFGVNWVPPFGGAIGMYNQLDGIWAVHVADKKISKLPKPKGILPNFVGWQDDTHYITFDSDEACESMNLRSVDVTSGEASPIMEHSFYHYISLSPENNALLFSGAPNCASSLDEGTYLLLPGEKDPTQLLDKRAWGIEWMPESQVFFAYPEALLSADGKTRYEPPVYNASYEPALSKSGYQAWEVIQNQKGSVMVKTPESDWQKILDGVVGQLIWDPIDGKTLVIFMEDGSIYSAAYPDFKPQLMGSKFGNIEQAMWLP